MRINGTLINYYFHCKRQCYLHGNRLNLEDNSEQVKIGKAIHEERAENSTNSEIAIENICLDKLTKEYLVGKLLVKQAVKYQNDRMDIARAIVKGIGVNIYEVLYHYYKHGKKEVKNTIDWIKKSFFPQVVQAEDVKELMAYEGEVWMRFYGGFVYFLPEDFVMNKRVKRPPDNPINALISFGNTLLYTKTIAAIYQTHLDQRISFLHEPSEGRFSLSLDLSEVFKPVIVFKTIFDLVNNRRLQVEKHFDKQVNYCVLNEEGRKIFIESFEERLESVFMHPKLKRKVSYRTALKLDCYKLIKNILEEKEFVPFSLKEGM